MEPYIEAIVNKDNTIRLHFRNDTNGRIHSQVDSHFTRVFKKNKFTNWKYGNKTQTKFMTKNNKLQIGMWNELRRLCRDFKFELRWKNSELLFNQKASDEFEPWLEDKKFYSGGDEISVRDNQVNAIKASLKYRYSALNATQRFGKTLVLYTTAWYMIDHVPGIDKVLIITVDDLAPQMYRDWIDYSGVMDGHSSPFKFEVLHGSVSKSVRKRVNAGDFDVLVGNFQTLKNLKPEFYGQFHAIFSDECHRLKAASVHYPIKHSVNAVYRIGMSGSMRRSEDADYFMMPNWTGSEVYKVSKSEQIEKGYARRVTVNIIRLDWLTVQEQHQIGEISAKKHMTPADMYTYECNMVRDSKLRLWWIANYISNLKGNVIALHLDVKYGYANRMADAVISINPSKEICYHNGTVDKRIRATHIESFKHTDKKVMFGTWQTLSTGKTIKNLSHVVMIESMKAYEFISQATGRGMTLYGDSEDQLCQWHDLVDDLDVKVSGTYAYNSKHMKHGSTRHGIYKEDGLSVVKYSVNLNDPSTRNLIIEAMNTEEDDSNFLW